MKRKKTWIIAFFFFLLVPTSVFSQTLADTFSKQINEEYGSRFTFIDVLSMEKVSKKITPTYVVEIAIQGKTKLRIPAKISKDDKRWKVDWLAKKEYVIALENLSKSKQLSVLEAPLLDTISRLPAFPVLLTSKRVLTPFGVLEKSIKGEPISPLSLHTSKWINGVLEGDPALAAFEIITPEQTKWSSIHYIMLQLAGVHGLFEMYLVGASSSGQLTSMKLRTTVGATMPTRIVSLARGAQYEGLKVVIKNEKGMKEVSTVCPTELPEGKYCSAIEDPIPKIMEGLFSVPLEKNERVILGFSKDVMVRDAMQYAAVLAEKLGVSSDRFLVTLVVE